MNRESSLPPGTEDKEPSVEKKEPKLSMEKSPVREKSRDRRRRSKSRDRRRKRTPSKSPRKSRSISNSPPYRNRNRFQRKSRSRSLERGGFGGRGRFRDRNFFDRRRDSRSRSRGRGGFEDRGRRFDNRRNNRRSNSPQRGNNDGYMQQQQQQQQQQVPVAPVMYGNDGSYGNFMPNAPAPPQFHHMPMQQQFNFDYQQQQPTYTASNFIQPDTNIYPPGDFVDPQLAAWPMMNVPPPMQPEESEEDKNKREAQIAQEKKTQREAIKEQRNQYISRSQIYKRELKVLKEQRTALIEGTPSNPPSPKTNKFVKENDKLQTQIQKKLVTILNVIDMLEELMGKDSSDDKESSSSKKKSSKKSRQRSPNSNDADKIKSEVLESMKKKQKVKEDSEDDRKKVNYIYYDPELHWCKACNVFPKSAKDYLLHLQSKDHAANTVKSAIETPWRDSFLVAAEIPATIPDVPTKRAPIRGIQFFMPVPSWYCKLCSVWMGDLHCASIHLKSPGHSDKYEELIATEPRCELDWLAKRQKALESCLPLGSIKEEQSASNGGMKLDDSEKKKDEKKSKKKKTKKDEKKDKKKRKRGKKRKKGSSSSSSSDSDDSDSSTSSTGSNDSKKKALAKVAAAAADSSNSNSIRVQMRNFLGMKKPGSDDPLGKWAMIPPVEPKPVPPPAPTISESSMKEKKRDELMIQQWTSPTPVISMDEKKLLDNLKGKLKQREPEKKEKVVEKSYKKSEVESRGRDRSRSRDRSRNNNYRGRRSRSRSGSNQRRRSRSRYRNRRRSSSRSRSRSWSRGRRVERPFVNFPPEPRLPPSRDDKSRLPARSYTATKKEVKSNDSKSSSASKKVLPFIGRMPVFKKQQFDKKTEMEEMQEAQKLADAHAALNPPEIVQEMDPEMEESEATNNGDNQDWDLIPDPEMMMRMHPPPPPIQEEPVEILPPGIDDAESEFIPKPISDAPIQRKGPLPLEFQQTLDLLFDGDTPKPVVIEQKPEPVIPIEPQPPMVIDDDQPHMVNMEDISQHGIYGTYGNFSSSSFFGQSAENHPAPDIPPPPPISIAQSIVADSVIAPLPPTEKKQKDVIPAAPRGDPKMNVNQMELDDLALLGIEMDDLVYDIRRK